MLFQFLQTNLKIYAKGYGVYISRKCMFKLRKKIYKTNHRRFGYSEPAEFWTSYKSNDDNNVDL